MKNNLNYQSYKHHHNNLNRRSMVFLSLLSKLSLSSKLYSRLFAKSLLHSSYNTSLNSLQSLQIEIKKQLIKLKRRIRNKGSKILTFSIICCIAIVAQSCKGKNYNTTVVNQKTSQTTIEKEIIATKNTTENNTTKNTAANNAAANIAKNQTKKNDDQITTPKIYQEYQKQKKLKSLQQDKKDTKPNKTANSQNMK